MKKKSSIQLFQEVFDCHNAGVSLMRQNLSRRYDASEIETRLKEWLQTRPGAEKGDCAGLLSDRIIENE